MPVAHREMTGAQREKINEMWTEFKSCSQFATMWTPVENWLHAQAIQRGVPAPKSNEPEPERPGAPVGASFRWMELIAVEPWFYRELGIGTVEDYFGPRQAKLRSRRLKQIAEAARAQAAEEKREILKRTVKS